MLTLGQAAERYPEYGGLYVALGRVWLQAARGGKDRIALSKALEALQSNAASSDTGPEVQALLGRALLQANQVEMAERVLQQAAAKLPADPETFVDLADAAEQLGHLADARTALLKYHALVGDDPNAAKQARWDTRIGELSLKLGDYRGGGRLAGAGGRRRAVRAPARGAGPGPGGRGTNRRGARHRRARARARAAQPHPARDLPEAALSLPRSSPRALMLRYLIRRLLLTLPVLLGVATLVFSLIHLVPGDPAQSMLGDAASPQEVAALRERLGLDQPLVVQYGHFLAGLAQRRSRHVAALRHAGRSARSRRAFPARPSSRRPR